MREEHNHEEGEGGEDGLDESELKFLVGVEEKCLEVGSGDDDGMRSGGKRERREKGSFNTDG